MGLLIRDVRWYSRGRTRQGSLRIGRGRVLEAGPGLTPGRFDRVLEGTGLLALPGLINGHDHLELNLFPRLGRPPYPDMYEWAREIYRPERSPLREILAVPLTDRLRWGGYRNLLGGATTVAHHDAYHRRVFGRRFPVRVVRRYGWAHSLGFTPQVADAWARSRGRPFMIHALEGVSPRAARELDELEALGVLTQGTVLVHAVALGHGSARETEARIAQVAASGAAVVWCPTSNRFLFGRTAPVARLLGRVPVCLGTDSTLSGPATLLDELRGAARTEGVGPDRALELVTTGAARVFGFRDGRGSLEPGAPGDLVLLPDTGGSAGQVLLETAPEDLALVLVRGRPHLADPARADVLGLGPPNARVGGVPRWLPGDPGALKARIARVVGPGVLESNPLWSLLEPAGERGTAEAVPRESERVPRGAEGAAREPGGVAREPEDREREPREAVP